MKPTSTLCFQPVRRFFGPLPTRNQTVSNHQGGETPNQSVEGEGEEASTYTHSQHSPDSAESLPNSQPSSPVPNDAVPLRARESLALRRLGPHNKPGLKE